MRFFCAAVLALVLVPAPVARELPAGDTQICNLLTPAEAESLVGARTDVTDAETPPGTLHCAWTVDDTHSIVTKLTITLVDGPALGGLTPAAWAQTARQAAKSATDLPGGGFVAEPDGVARAVVASGDWVALIGGPGVSREAVSRAAQLAAGRLGTVQHPVNRDPLPASCALLSVTEAAAALGALPYLTPGDTSEGQGVCGWSYGGTTRLSLAIREGAELGGLSASQYYQNARDNEAVSRPIGDVDAGERAFISPADPDGAYFYLMVKQNGRIAIMSGLGLGRDAAERAAQAIASRM